MILIIILSQHFLDLTIFLEFLDFSEAFSGIELIEYSYTVWNATPLVHTNSSEIVITILFDFKKDIIFLCL